MIERIRELSDGQIDSLKALGKDALTAISPPVAYLVYGNGPDQLQALQNMGPDELGAMSPQLAGIIYGPDAGNQDQGLGDAAGNLDSRLGQPAGNLDSRLGRIQASRRSLCRHSHSHQGLNLLVAMMVHSRPILMMIFLIWMMRMSISQIRGTQSCGGHSATHAQRVWTTQMIRPDRTEHLFHLATLSHLHTITAGAA